MSVFEAVREGVTAKEAALRYGIKIGKGGMARCLFHKDRNPSMKVDRRFYTNINKIQTIQGKR